MFIIHTDIKQTSIHFSSTVYITITISKTTWKFRECKIFYIDGSLFLLLKTLAAFCHIKFQSKTKVIYFDWLSTVLWLRDIFKRYFNHWQKNWYRSKPVKDQTFMMSTWTGDVHKGHYCSFLLMEGLREERSQNWSFFVAVINVWSVIGLELQPIQSLEVVLSSLTSSHKPDTFWLLKEQPLAPPPTLLMTKPKHLLLPVGT